MAGLDNEGRIQKLPNELLLHVFELSQRRTYTPSRYDRPRLAYPWRRPEEDDDHFYWAGGASWTSLMLVCRFWREIFLQSPCLWQSVDIHTDIRWLELVLARSGNAPLELFFHDLDTARAAIPMILPHTRRLRKLILPPLDQPPRGSYDHVNPNVSQFLELFRKPLPVLDELMLSVENDHRADEVVYAELDWSKIRHPCLRTLRVACVKVPWSTALLSDLTCLDLRTCAALGAPLSCSQFLDVLERCRSLVELRLVDRFVSAALQPHAISATTAAPSRTLQLPALRKLVLADYPATTTWLLSHLAFTGNISVTVEGWLQRDWDILLLDDTFSSLVPLPALRTRFFPAAQPTQASIVIRDGEDELTLRVWSGDGAELLLRLRTLHRLGGMAVALATGIREFVRIFRHFPIEDLYIDGHLKGAQDVRCWGELLESLPELQKLEITGRGSIDALLLALKHTPLTVNGSSDGDTSAPRPPPCPNLCRLSFDYPDYARGDVELMVAVLNRRAHFELAPMDKLEFFLSYDQGDEGNDEAAFKAEIITYLSELKRLCSRVTYYYTDCPDYDGSD